MTLTKKTRYAIRALIELAKFKGKGPVKTVDIANAQKIPQRFLEVILNQLKTNGFVDAKRGYHGGYSLIKSPQDITIKDVFQLTQKPISPYPCAGCESEGICPYEGECLFSNLWEKVTASVYSIYQKTTIQDLIPEKCDNRL